MDFESTLSTIAGLIPEDLTQAIGQATAYIPKEVSQVIWHASSYLPAEINWVSAAQFLLYFALASLVTGSLGRVVLGKRSSLNHALSAVMGILFIYAATIVVYTFKPWNLEALLSPLPFVTFSGEYMIVLPVTDSQLPALCSQILSLIILAFLVNLMDSILPKGDSVLSWLIIQVFSVIASMALHFGVTWAFETYLPDVLVQYTPAILLFLLVFLMLSGVVSLLLGLVIAVTNPFLGAMYSFFFSNVIGKQLSKAMFTSLILGVIVYLLEYYGYTILCINAASLLTYIPVALVVLGLWYLIGNFL